MNDFSWSCCPICFYRAFFRFLACLLALCSDSSFSRLCLRPVQKLHSDRSGLSQGSSSRPYMAQVRGFFTGNQVCVTLHCSTHTFTYFLSKHTLLFPLFPLLPRHIFYTLLLIFTAFEAFDGSHGQFFCFFILSFFFSLFSSSLLLSLFSLFSSPP